MAMNDQQARQIAMTAINCLMDLGHDESSQLIKTHVESQRKLDKIVANMPHESAELNRAFRERGLEIMRNEELVRTRKPDLYQSIVQFFQNWQTESQPKG